MFLLPGGLGGLPILGLPLHIGIGFRLLNGRFHIIHNLRSKPFNPSPVVVVSNMIYNSWTLLVFTGDGVLTQTLNIIQNQVWLQTIRTGLKH